MKTTALQYEGGERSCAHSYLLPLVERIVEDRRPQKIFDLGCGNGSVGNTLSRYAAVTGVDPSESGVGIARRSFPHLTVRTGSAYDDLATEYGTFPLVISLEVVEHLYDPRLFAKRLYQLVEPGGVAVVSTPYHGYWKNLALALSGKLDRHFTVLWDGGHIKFFSVRTLTELLQEAGFGKIDFQFVGRVPLLAKTMIAVAHKHG